VQGTKDTASLTYRIGQKKGMVLHLRQEQLKLDRPQPLSLILKKSTSIGHCRGCNERKLDPERRIHSLKDLLKQ
jgi:hypothetical protein